MFDFIGKKILITGASGGIGKELTKSFLENGADVFITGTNSQKLTLLNKELKGKCKTIECNLLVADAAKFMQENKIYNLVVKENTSVVGFLTMHQILESNVL